MLSLIPVSLAGNLTEILTNMKLKHSEIDALCMALLAASESTENEDMSKVYEALRLKIRKDYPLNISMAKLVKELNV